MRENWVDGLENQNLKTIRKFVFILTLILSEIIFKKDAVTG